MIGVNALDSAFINTRRSNHFKKRNRLYVVGRGESRILQIKAEHGPKFASGIDTRQPDRQKMGSQSALAESFDWPSASHANAKLSGPELVARHDQCHVHGQISKGHPMISHYRNHLIKLDGDEQLTAEITDLEADAVFPLRVTASKKEGIEVCLERARELVDVYLDAAKFD